MTAWNILTRMQDVFYSIMNNWKEAENAMSLMTESAGTLQRSYDEYLDTTTAHINTFKSAFAELGSDIFRTGFLNEIVDIGTGIIHILDSIVKLTNAVGGLKTVLLGIGGVIAVIKADAIVTALTLIPTKLAALAAPLLNVVTVISRIPAVFKSMTSGTAVAVQGTSRLSAALQGLGITASAAQLAIGSLVAVITAISLVRNAIESAEQEARAAAQSGYDSASENLEKYQEFEDAYVSAVSLKAAGNEHGFTTAVQSASKALEGKAAAFDAASGSASSYLTYLKTIRYEELKSALDDANDAKNEASKLLKGDAWSVLRGSKITIQLNEQMTGVDEHVKALEVVNEKMAEYIDLGTYGNEIEPINFDSDRENVDAIVDYYYALEDTLAAMRAAERESGETGTITNSQLYEDMRSTYKALTEDVNKYTEARLNEENIRWKQNNEIPTTVEGYMSMRDAILDATGATGSYRDELSEMLDLEYPDLSSQAKQYEDVANKLTEIRRNIYNTASGKGGTNVGNAYLAVFNTWYDALPEGEKSLVYKISLEQDTGAWTPDDWKNAVANYEIPEEDKISFSEIIKSDEDGSFRGKINSYIDSINALKEAKDKLIGGTFTSSDFKKLVETFPELADDADDLVPAIEDVMNALTGVSGEAGDASGIMRDFEDALKKCATEEDKAALIAYRDAIISIAEADNNLKIGDSISESTNKIKEFISGISEMQAAIGSQQGGKSIDIDTFSSEALRDYRGALELVNGSMQLNAEKCREIAKAKAEEEIAINDANKAIAQAKYLENVREIEKYRQKLAEAKAANNGAADSIQESIDALVSENSALADTCAQYDLLSSSIREAVGEYQNWLNAQSASDYGDMANDTVDAITKIRDTFREGTEDFGNYGSKKFEAALDFIVPDSVDTEDLTAIESYMNSFKKYITLDEDGATTGLNVDKFLWDSVDKGLMSYSQDEGFKILGSQKMEDFAEGLNLSMGVVQAMFDQLQLKGAEFDWGDEAVKTIGDLAVEAGEAAESLRTITGNEDLKIKIDISDLTTTEEQVAALDATITEMNTVKVKPGIDLSEIDNANAVIQYCVSQKQLLTQPDVMRVDVSQVEEDIGNALSLLQQFQRAQNDLEIQKAVGVDTSGAQAKVDELAAQISQISPNIKANLSINSTSADTIQSFIDSLSAEKIVSLGVNADAIAGFNPETKTCDVIYNPNTDLLPESFDQITRDVYYEALTDKLPNSFSTITRYVNYVRIGDVDENGTAHAGGTAKAIGSLGSSPGGNTLVGELGREMIVDVRTGRWYTVGDTGAEFRNIPPGAIVFNHKQTEDLLANGYVAGRARALAGGTAMVRGGYKPYTPTPSSQTGGASTDEDDSKIIDWIEIAIDRIERAIDKVSLIAESSFRKITERLGAINDEITLTNDKISLERNAYNRYIKEANSVGLSSSLKAKVQNGTIDITEYDKDIAERIKDYQKWYEKALECRDAIDELTESLGELYQNKFSMVQDEYENQLSLLEHMTNSYNNAMDNIEARGYLASTKLFEAQKNVQTRNIEALNYELKDLTDRMSEAVNSGAVEEGSEAWYEMQIQINGVKESIQEANTEIINLNNSIRETEWAHFDYLQERISDINDEAQFLVDLLSHSELFEEGGQLTDAGMATMGMYAEKYNVYMAQADKYAEEIKKLNADIANDPNNTKLIERKNELVAAQRDAILAAESEKDAIVDLVRQGIEKELESLRELIDTYNESMDSAKNLYDYQKKVKEQTEDIASLQKQLSAYANDTSEEARATVQKLEVDLSNAMESLEETQYDRYISEQKKLLDELYTEYETVLNTRLDDVNALISDMIDTVNTNSSDISSTITTAADNVGYTLSQATSDIWNNEGNAFKIVSTYGDAISGGITSVKTVLDGIATNVASMVKESDDTATQTVTTTTPTTNTNNTGKPPATTTTPTQPTQTQSNNTKFNEDIKRGVAAAIWIYGSKSGWGNNPERKKKLTAKFGATNAAAVQSYINAHANNGDLYRYWVSTGKNNLSKYYYSAFKTGGLADFTGPAWLDGTPDKPEIVLNADDSKNFMALKDAMREVANGTSPLSALFSGGHDTDIIDGLSKVGQVDNGISGGIGDVTYNITIPIDHVEDYEDFMNHMRKDRQFEELIQSMTVDRLAGGSKIAKNKFRW